MRTINHNTPIEKLYKYRKAEAIRKCRRLKEMHNLGLVSGIEARLRSRWMFRRSYLEVNEMEAAMANAV